MYEFVDDSSGLSKFLERYLHQSFKVLCLEYGRKVERAIRKMKWMDIDGWQRKRNDLFESKARWKLKVSQAGNWKDFNNTWFCSVRVKSRNLCNAIFDS